MGNKKNKKEIEKMHVEREKLDSNEKKKVMILELISVVLAIVAEFIFVKTGNNFSTPRLITLFGLISFIGLHFTIGFKKLYALIVENRFKLSIIMVVISTFVGYLKNGVGNPDWIYNTNTVLSLWWNIKFYSLLLVSYELFNIITDSSKGASVVGTVVLAFSGATVWNFDKIDSLVFGQLIVVLIDKIIKQDNKIKRFIMQVLTIICTCSYFYTFEGFAISFGYVFLALIIWILIKNKDNKKGIINGILAIIVGLASAILLKVMQPVHYNDVIEPESRGLSLLYTYLYNIYLPFKDFGENTALYGSFISAFPIPMLFALYYMYKNDDHLEFLLPITLVAVLETIFCVSGLPGIINKVFLFEKVSLSRGIAAVNLANVYMAFYLVKHIDKKMFSITVAMRIAVIQAIVVGLIGYPEIIRTLLNLNLFVIISSMLSFLFLIFDEKSYKNGFLFVMCLITLIGGITVNPIL